MCTWQYKVYIWPFLVGIGQILVYTLFAHHANRRSKAVILSVNRAIHNVCDVSDVWPGKLKSLLDSINARAASPIRAFL